MKLFKPVKRDIPDNELYLMGLENQLYVEFYDLDHNPIPLDDMSINKIYELIQWQETWNQANV